MPGQFLSKAERERLQSFPKQITTNEIIIFFTLSDKDLTLVKKRSGDHNLLGFALQLGTLRYLSFIPDNFPQLPLQVIEYVAQQIKVSAEAIADYGERSQTRTSQLQEIQNYLGFRKPSKTDYQQLEKWLLERAMEHDRPLLLFQLLIKKLEIAKIIRPGLTILERMARLASLSYHQLAWCNNWYLRESTLKAANTKIVNFQYRLPLSQIWGGGTLSSSDGQRFPVSVKNRMAVSLPRYFGYGQGVSFYSWTSDQFSQYGSKPTISTLRDSTYVLDEILDNETELPIMEHTTDTAGYTELVFAMFDLLGLQFSPRIKDLGGQRLYRAERDSEYQHIESLLSGTIKTDKILSRWDDMLRVAGSLKLGWVTASLFLSKLKSFPQQNDLASSFAEYGRMIKTIFILRYLMNQPYRRKINNQLNKGERLHDLRRFLFFAHQGAIRQRQEEELTNQASCLNLITNA